jgi:nitrate reductase beta subunit
MELAITPREAAAGDYFESNLKGVLTSNQVDTDYATLQTAVYEEWLVLYTYRYGSTRMLGNDKRACRLSLGQRANNSNNQEDMTVSLSLLSEKTPPFYVI